MRDGHEPLPPISCDMTEESNGTRREGRARRHRGGARLRRLRIGIRRRTPRPHHLRGTMLHRWFGDRIFDARLWSPTPHEVAAGLGLGVFVALTPTMSVQLVVAALAAYLLRVNLPATLLACWITNPVTAPVIYPLEYKLGMWLSGAAAPSELAGLESGLRSFMRYAKPLWIGSVVTAVPMALGVYAGTRFAWSKISHLFPGRTRSSRDWRALRRAHLATLAGLGEPDPPEPPLEDTPPATPPHDGDRSA